MELLVGIHCQTIESKSAFTNKTLVQKMPHFNISLVKYVSNLAGMAMVAQWSCIQNFFGF